MDIKIDRPIVTISDNNEWLKNNSKFFKNEWVALKNGYYIDHDKSRLILYNRLKTKNLLQGILFVLLTDFEERNVKLYLHQTGLDYIFPLVERLEKIKDPIKYHSEKNVFVHTCQVVTHAFRETKDVHLIMAALLHDIGKYEDSYNHPKIGYDILKNMNSKLLSFKVADLVRDHLLIQLYLGGELKKLKKVQQVLINPNFKDLVQLRRWDIMGRDKYFFPNWDKLKIKILNLVLDH